MEGNSNSAALPSSVTVATTETSTAPSTDAAPPRRRRVIVRRNRKSRRNGQEEEEKLREDPDLCKAIASSLPADYEFEIAKTIARIRKGKSQDKEEGSNSIEHVALQMPEGLLMYGCTMADLLLQFSPPTLRTVSLLGDVTYGACCVADLDAAALGAELLVHYGHSCLVPVTHTVIPCLYVFVEIRIDVQHLVDCVCATLQQPSNSPTNAKNLQSNPIVHLMGTVQFRGAVVQAAEVLRERNFRVQIPQAKPLSPGEVLGCTAPSNLAQCSCDNKAGTDAMEDSSSVMVFVADGRFHLEAAMIANPTLRALRYDPYAKVLTEERYETEKMKGLRRRAIRQTAHLLENKKLSSSSSLSQPVTIGIVLGTLGRQGNPAILSRVRSLLRKHGCRSFVLLLSEVLPRLLDSLPVADAWVQVACPRLSIDWGHYFSKPLLTPYELHVCLGEVVEEEVYPMDYYRLETGGAWSNYHEANRQRQATP